MQYPGARVVEPQLYVHQLILGACRCLGVGAVARYSALVPDAATRDGAALGLAPQPPGDSVPHDGLPFATRTGGPGSW